MVSSLTTYHRSWSRRLFFLRKSFRSPFPSVWRRSPAISQTGEKSLPANAPTFFASGRSTLRPSFEPSGGKVFRLPNTLEKRVRNYILRSTQSKIFIFLPPLSSAWFKSEAGVNLFSGYLWPGRPQSSHHDGSIAFPAKRFLQSEATCWRRRVIRIIFWSKSHFDRITATYAILLVFFIEQK